MLHTIVYPQESRLSSVSAPFSVHSTDLWIHIKWASLNVAKVRTNAIKLIVHLVNYQVLPFALCTTPYRIIKMTMKYEFELAGSWIVQILFIFMISIQIRNNDVECSRVRVIIQIQIKTNNCFPFFSPSFVPTANGASGSKILLLLCLCILAFNSESYFYGVCLLIQLFGSNFSTRNCVNGMKLTREQ